MEDAASKQTTQGHRKAYMSMTWTYTHKEREAMRRAFMTCLLSKLLRVCGDISGLRALACYLSCIRNSLLVSFSTRLDNKATHGSYNRSCCTAVNTATQWQKESACL